MLAVVVGAAAAIGAEPVAQERSLGVNEKSAGAKQLATADLERIADIAELLDLTEQQTGELTNMIRHQRLPTLDVPVAENLEARGGRESVAKRAGLSVSERNTLDKLLARRDVRNWDDLQRLSQDGKLSDQEESVVTKLVALGDGEFRMQEGVRKLRESGTASDREAKILEQLEWLTARRSMESLLFKVRQTFDPNLEGKARWSALHRRDIGWEGPQYVALVHCPAGGRFPVRMSGEEDTLFWVTLLDGTDDRLRVEVRNHEDDRRELTIGRDKLERFEVTGRAYSLLFLSTYVEGSQPRATGEAFLIVRYHPVKQTKESTGSRDQRPGVK
jgi:hypothetical protein